MRFMRRQNTAKIMAESGLWAKIGKKHYRYHNGNEIKYECNHWMWVINGENKGYKALADAKWEVERREKAFAHHLATKDE